MKKRIVALALIGAMVASLAACGSTSTDTTAAAGSADAEAETTTESSGGDGVITYWNIATEGADQAIVTYQVDTYNETYAAETGYTVEQTAIQNDKYKEKIVIAMSSGECPDMYSSWSGGPLKEYIASGYAQPVTDIVTELGLDQILLPAALAQGTFDGEVYGIPYLNISIAGVFYNKTIFEEQGLEVPTTISELEAVCDKLVAAGITPFALGNSSMWQGSMFYQSFATRYAGNGEMAGAYDGTGKLNAECFVYAGDKITDWASKGYFQEACNSVSTDDGQDKQMLYTNQAAMICSGSWYTSTFASDSEEWYTANVDWFPFPVCDDIDNGDDYYYVANGTIGDQFVSFNITDADKLKAAVQCVACSLTEDGIALSAEQGKIPPVQGVEEYITDPVGQKIVEYANNCTDVQLWYDQYLPAAVKQVHLEKSQGLFDGTVTSQDCADATQAAMEEYLAGN